MDPNIVAESPWTEWKKQQEQRQTEEKLKAFSSWKRRDFISLVRELGKMKKVIDEQQKKFINRLARYEDGQLLTHDEVKYLAKTYHYWKESAAGHKERCPVCNGTVKLD